jgi:hypothetical protein
MSHFTSVTVEMKNLDAIEAALKAIGHSDIRRNATVRGYMGNSRTDDLVVHHKSGYDIGLSLKDGKVEITADWWGLGSGVDQHSFTDALTQRYSVIESMGALQAKGFTFQEEMDGEELVLTCTRWV